MSWNALGLSEVLTDLREGRVSAKELAETCLQRTEEFEPSVEAWAYLNPEHVLAQAAHCDSVRRKGYTLGPLHGIPIGVKDIFDTDDMPTEFGSKALAGRQPRSNATVVSKLRSAGAVIFGKTVTAEMANKTPGKTRNPHDPTRTPGGSSSGSAAAVASFMVPGAIGTQTAGSVIRPASFCGVHGFKPTYGSISRHGVLLQSHLLDQIGVFGRSLADCALLAQTIMGFDPEDAAMHVDFSVPDLVGVAASEPPVPPRFAFIKTPHWGEAEGATQEAMLELCEALGDRVTEVELPSSFNGFLEHFRNLMAADNAFAFEVICERSGDVISPALHEIVANGKEIKAVDYLRAIEVRDSLNALLDEAVFDDYDAVITPSTTGEAPVGLETTGDPIFCSLWNYLGVPSVNLPLMQGEAGLPLGVQLVGARRDDARLLRAACWLEQQLESEEP